MSPLKNQGPQLRVSPVRGSPERAAPRVTFNEKVIQSQAAGAAERKAALRQRRKPPQEEPVQRKKTPEGQEGQTAKGEKWKQQAKLKGKGKGKQSESGSAAEARRVEMR